MKRFHSGLVGVSVPVLLALASAALGQTEIPLKNWEVPLYNGLDLTNSKSADSGTSSRHGIHALSDIGLAVPFQAVTPCRVVNTRNANGPYGGPSIPAGGSRDFALNANPACPGIPAVVTAYSINVTAADTSGAGFLKVYPTGGTVPVVSTVNYSGPGQAVANAAIAPAGSGGAVTVVAGVSGANVIIDINGYFTGNLNVEQGFNLVGTYNPILPGVPGGIAYFQNNTTSIGYSLNSSIASSTDGSASIHGSASGTGAVHGISGDSGSVAAGASGVFGRDAVASTGTSDTSAGVIGSSRDFIGVEGISDHAGVRGELYSSGSIVTLGILGLAGGTPYGVWATGNFGGTGAKYFVEPHPKDASKVIRYIALEGPEAGTYFRGRGRFVSGLATIDVPEDFRMVTDSEGLSAQITPIGEMAAVAVVRIDLDKVVVKSSRDVEFFYTVNGVRRTHKDLKPIGPGQEFMPRSATAPMPGAYTQGQIEMLISNGTYKADGTVNMETAKRLGWDKVWASRGQPTAPEAAPNGSN